MAVTPEVVIDAVGTSESFSDALRAAGPEGRVHLFGLPEEPLSGVPMELLLFKELRISSSTGAPRLWPAAMTLIEHGLLKVAPLITHRFDLRAGAGGAGLPPGEPPAGRQGRVRGCDGERPEMTSRELVCPNPAGGEDRARAGGSARVGSLQVRLRGHHLRLLRAGQGLVDARTGAGGRGDALPGPLPAGLPAPGRGLLRIQEEDHQRSPTPWAAGGGAPAGEPAAHRRVPGPGVRGRRDAGKPEEIRPSSAPRGQVRRGALHLPRDRGPRA